MREYPRNSTFDSVSESRVSALAGFGFTQRQRECLVTVMVHGALRANGARIRLARTGHGIERIPLTSPQSYLHVCEPQTS